MKIRVFVREVNEENYPSGLAGSVHFEVITDAGKRETIGRNYGILFAKGTVAENNTIVPRAVKNPVIFRMGEGWIGIAANRVMENGEPDGNLNGKILLWKTRDLISFSEEAIVSCDEVNKWNPSDAMEIEKEIVEGAKKYWNPIWCTGVSFPGEISVRDERELDDATAIVSYSDGSLREKKVLWDKTGISFDKNGEVEVRGKVHQMRFKFPLAKGYGDPVIFPWEGKWYFISTNDNLNDIGIYVREAEDVHGLFADGVKEHLILPFDPDRGLEQTFWAPEFHVIGGELYILFAVSGHVWGPQCHMMRKKKGCSIIEADSWENPIPVCRMDGSPLGEGAITLDMTYLKAKSGSYLIWSYREHIGTPLDTGSMLYIATTDEKKPWILTSEPVLLTRPLYGWENVSGTINNEGPNCFIHDGKVYVTYSGGSANSYTYALGLLTADEKDDLLDISSWNKSISPVLTFYSVKDEFGPGHNSFFTNEDGELMIAYHGETDIKSTLRCDGIRRVHFRSDGTPYFQMAAWEDVTDCEIRSRVIISK